MNSQLLFAVLSVVVLVAKTQGRYPMCYSLLALQTKKTVIITILCTVAAQCTTGQLRLTGGNIPNEGRVEICMRSAWGTVCDDYWRSFYTTLVCRQLGYSTQGQTNSSLEKL